MEQIFVLVCGDCFKLDEPEVRVYKYKYGAEKEKGRWLKKKLCKHPYAFIVKRAIRGEVNYDYAYRHF